MKINLLNNQRGISIPIVLTTVFLGAGLVLGVYLVGQRTNLIPFAKERGTITDKMKGPYLNPDDDYWRNREIVKYNECNNGTFEKGPHFGNVGEVKVSQVESDSLEFSVRVELPDNAKDKEFLVYLSPYLPSEKKPCDAIIYKQENVKAVNGVLEVKFSVKEEDLDKNINLHEATTSAQESNDVCDEDDGRWGRKGKDDCKKDNNKGNRKWQTIGFTDGRLILGVRSGNEQEGLVFRARSNTINVKPLTRGNKGGWLNNRDDDDHRDDDGDGSNDKD